MCEASLTNVFEVSFDSPMQGSSYNCSYIWQMSTDFVSISVGKVYKSSFSDQIFAAIWNKRPEYLLSTWEFQSPYF